MFGIIEKNYHEDFKICLKNMVNKNPKNPLEGKTLEKILTELVERYGFPVLDEKIRINCFAQNPSIKSSLIFLRKTPWARAKVEKLYLKDLQDDKKNS